MEAERALPVAVRGPVDLVAFMRLASRAASVMVFLREVTTGVSIGISTVEGSLVIDWVLFRLSFSSVFIRFLLSRN